MIERNRKRADYRRKVIARWKRIKGCIDCGYDKNSLALELDHKNNLGIPFTGRQRSVSSLMYSSWELIKEELNKCDVVCANCHSIRTYTRRKISLS